MIDSPRLNPNSSVIKVWKPTAATTSPPILQSLVDFHYGCGNIGYSTVLFVKEDSAMAYQQCLNAQPQRREFTT